MTLKYRHTRSLQTGKQDPTWLKTALYASRLGRPTRVWVCEFLYTLLLSCLRERGTPINCIKSGYQPPPLLPQKGLTSCEELTHWKRPWCWEGLGAGGEGDDRGWDGWMASLTWGTWVWVNSGCWWWTGRPGVLWFMGSQRVGHKWVIELNWKLNTLYILFTHEVLHSGHLRPKGQRAIVPNLNNNQKTSIHPADLLSHMFRKIRISSMCRNFSRAQTWVFFHHLLYCVDLAPNSLKIFCLYINSQHWGSTQYQLAK